MKPYRMTKGQIKKALQQNKYIVLTRIDGLQLGLNCKAVLNCSITTDWSTELKYKTFYHSFRPVGIMEYITYKLHF